MRAARRSLLAALIVALSAGVALAAPKDGGQLLPGTACPAFPADNVWNTPVTGLPVDSHSAAWLANMSAASSFLHPDYGPGGGTSPYGIPWQRTSAHPDFIRLHFLYADE